MDDDCPIGDLAEIQREKNATRVSMCNFFMTLDIKGF